MLQLSAAPRNFRVGAILADSQLTRAHEVIRERIARGVAGSILGISPPPSFRLLYDRAAKQVFGRARAMRCPYFDNELVHGTCSIWQHRNSVCFTWYCKHERGAVGGGFWATARAFLEEAETIPAETCAVKLGRERSILGVQLRERRSDPLLAAELVGALSDSGDTSEWGEWSDKRMQYFARCWDVAREISIAQLMRDHDARLRPLVDRLHKSYARHEERTVPTRLWSAALSVSPERGTPGELLRTAGSIPSSFQRRCSRCCRTSMEHQSRGQ